MIMRNNVLYIYIMCVVAMMTAACGRRATQDDITAYRLTCHVDKGLLGDSAQLYIVEDGYHRLLNGGLRIGKPGTSLVWDGHIDGPRVAFIRWQGFDRPFFFVLEPGNIGINLHAHGWKIDGSRNNNDYMRFLNHRHNIQMARDNSRSEYLKHVADSTLTADLELQYQQRDSILCDSLNRYTAWRMAQDDPVAVIARERFYNSLPKKYQ